MDRPARVLVAYASGHGATRGVAERLAERLGEHGSQVEVLPVGQVHDVAGSYDAVVLGSGVYDGSWLPEATAFARRHRGALVGRPVWLFSVGAFGNRHRAVGALMKREPRDVAELQDAIQPRDYRVFAGVIERERWPLAGRMVFRGLGGSYGDNRDWAEIDAWADGIARALESPS
jgi:menaquinone-dependent protoporphyrinogen oxidase